MFKWLTSTAPRKKPEIRDTLFGDMPLEQYLPRSPQTAEPWTSFFLVKQSLDDGNKQSAIATLQSILLMRDLESRHYLQAWHFLRDLGVTAPINKAKEVLGVVAEVGMDRGLDLVAAYPDHHARYYNFSGAGVIWERPDNSLDHDQHTYTRGTAFRPRALLRAFQRSHGGPILGLAFQLMQQLIKLSKKP